MGGLIATRYAQRSAPSSARSSSPAPVIGGNPDYRGAARRWTRSPTCRSTPPRCRATPRSARPTRPTSWSTTGPFQRGRSRRFVAASQRVAQGGDVRPLPTLWIHGEEDPLAPLGRDPAGDRARPRRRFEEQIYPGARHEIFNEINQDEVIADVVAFLDLALGDGAPRSSVRPADRVLLAVAALGLIGADGDQLEAVGAGLEGPHDARARRGRRPTPRADADLVVEPDPARAADDDVGLLLLAVACGRARAEARARR